MIGTYHWILTLRPNPLTDMETLSDCEFMILPKFELVIPDELLMEGKISYFSVKCDHPLISTQDGSSTDIIQIDFKPDVTFNTQQKKLIPVKVEKSIRLVFPPTKVNIEFIPSKIFAAGLILTDKFNIKIITDIFRCKVFYHFYSRATG